MLKTIELVNFLSYKKSSISFSDNSTIAVVGDVGQGKSGLLESILFGLYGEGRENLEALIRTGSDGKMYVRLTLENVPKKDNSVIIERGFNKKGYTEVFLNKKLIAKGSAKYSNNEAQEYINSILGITKDQFLLTSFFGVGSTDMLMNVAPSVTLETLQMLAGVEICQKFNTYALEKVKEYNNKINSLSTTIDTLNSTTGNISELKEELVVTNKEIKEINAKIDTNMSIRLTYNQNETKYQSLLKELAVIKVKREEVSSSNARISKKLLEISASITDIKKQSSKLHKSKIEIENKLNKADIKNSENKLNAMKQELIELATIIELLEHTSSTDGECLCKVCNTKLTAEKISLLKINLNKNYQKYNTMKSKIEKDEKELKTLIDMNDELNDINESLSDNATELLDYIADQTSLNKQKAIVSSNLEKIETRLVNLKKEISGYSDLVSNIESIDSDISTLNVNIGKLKQKAIYLKKQIANITLTNEGIDNKKNEVNDYMKTMYYYSIVANAFSRYSIPVLLLKNLRSAIEKKATRIYQYFNSGFIRIVDTEGARPGVEFKLQDSVGIRSYKSLSGGEKVTVYISIRVAISQILNATTNNNVNFLILDEVAGNLSPVMRGSLTKLINTLLKNYFSQIFTVSHVELRNIFNTVLTVEKKNDISCVEIL